MAVRDLPAVTRNVSLFFSLSDVNKLNVFCFEKKMTWCSKLYGIFNGWNEEDNELPTIESSKVRRINSNFYRHTIEDMKSNSTILQHDSPFLERSNSLTNTHFINEQLYPNEYSDRYLKNIDTRNNI